MLLRIVAAALAGLLALTPAVAAAPPPERAAEPFPVVPLPEKPKRSHAKAWITMAAGAGLVAGSFLLHEQANRTYDDYLASTDPREIEELYDRTETQDRWSAAALISGEALLAAGIYMRFIGGRGGARLALAARPGRLAATWRF